MLKKHKQKSTVPKRTAKEPDSPGALEVSFTANNFRNEVIQHCEVKLRELLGGASRLAFQATPYTRDLIRFSLTGSAIRAVAGSRSYSVFPLRSITDPYWVGVHVDFEFRKTRLRLRAASIVLFKGERDSVLIPTLRAEWDCPSLDVKRRHAQPHWHVYQRPAPLDMTLPPAPEAELQSVRSLDDFEPGEPLFTELALAVTEAHAEPELDVDRQDTDIAGKNIHLAMCARWHHEEGHSVEFTTMSFARWMVGCLSYLLVQLGLAEP